MHIYNDKKKGNSRIQRHRIRTQGFKFQMKHIPGKQNPCDYPSRHPIALKNIDPKKLSNAIIENGEEFCISQIDIQNLPTAITLQMIKKATAKDKDLQELAQHINRGYYKDTPELRPYKNIFTELGHEEGIIKRGDKIVVPKSLKRRGSPRGTSRGSKNETTPQDHLLFLKHEQASTRRSISMQRMPVNNLQAHSGPLAANKTTHRPMEGPRQLL